MSATKKNKTLVASIPSQTGQDVIYDIHKNGVGQWTCSCPAFQYTRPDAKGRRFPCKHLRLAFKTGQALKKQGFELGMDKETGTVIYASSKF